MDIYHRAFLLLPTALLALYGFCAILLQSTAGSNTALFLIILPAILLALLSYIGGAAYLGFSHLQKWDADRIALDYLLLSIAAAILSIAFFIFTLLFSFIGSKSMELTLEFTSRFSLSPISFVGISAILRRLENQEMDAKTILICALLLQLGAPLTVIAALVLKTKAKL